MLAKSLVRDLCDLEILKHNYVKIKNCAMLNSRKQDKIDLGLTWLIRENVLRTYIKLHGKDIRMNISGDKIRLNFESKDRRADGLRNT